ncbi:MAG: sensor domain-containing diguanylate cyclase [Rhizobiaceae bacterium]
MTRPNTDTEEGRLDNLRSYHVLDTPPEENFDRITRLAQSALKVPIAIVSLVDDQRQWFKSKQGLFVSETPREYSFCAHAIEQDTPFIINDATQDSRFQDNPLVTGEPNIRFYAGIPLKTPSGFNIGTLCVIDTVAREISPLELTILQDLARLVIDEFELRQIAIVDSLTGALTHRAFDLALSKEIVRAQRYSLVFTLVILDIDHFKSVNDTYGHAAGDLVLQAFANLCRSTLRDCDTFARLGGEEFAILIPETGIVDAKSAIERLCKQIADAEIDVLDNKINVTASFGISVYASNGVTQKQLLDCADAALYQAKNAGQDCVSIRLPKSELQNVA